MEEQKPVDNNAPVKKASSKRPSLVVTIVLLLLLAGLISVSFSYMKSRQKVTKLNSEVSSLKTRVGELGGVTGEAPAASSGGSAECTGGSKYKANIGKFTVTLDSPRVIVRTLDAGFEGGPVTNLEIGTCLPDEQNVVDKPITGEVKILGHPASTAAELRTAYESRNGPLTSVGTMTIAGVTAQKYTQDGLFSTTVLYFDNAGIGYEVELVDTNDTTNAILADLVADWVFTP